MAHSRYATCPLSPRAICKRIQKVVCYRYALSEEDVLCQVQHALKLVGMEKFKDRPVHTLSGGQKQRVAIAGALAECPQVRVNKRSRLYLVPHGISSNCTCRAFFLSAVQPYSNLHFV